MNTAVGCALLCVALSSASLVRADTAQDWRKIDFDADLTTYLVDIHQITHSGDSARLIELSVPGRTSIATGAQSHTRIERLFDCAHGSENLGEITYFRSLTDAGRRLAHPDQQFEIRSGSLDEIMFNMACHGASAPSSSGYSSVEEAVRRSFMDAIKLPPDQSVRTRTPFRPPGEPIHPAP